MTAHTGLAVSPTGAGAGTTPQGTRLSIGGLLAKDGSSPLAVRRGILFDGRGAVVSGTGGMSYEVRPCVAVVMPSPTQGPVVVPTSATVAVATTPAPGSNSRIDVIWIRQRLTAADAGSDSLVTAEWGVTQGTASATPVAPTIPTGALEVARATVTAGATSTGALTIAQTHAWTAAAGAPIPVRSDTERAALTGYDGLLINHLGRKNLERHDGTAWRVVGSPTWQPYTPVWTSGGTNPSIGNGSLTGEWRDSGGLIEFWVQIVFGSTTNGGSGIWRLSPPTPGRPGRFSVNGTAYDPSSGSWPVTATMSDGGTYFSVFTLPTSAGAALRAVGGAVPFTFNTDDVLELSGSYRRA